MLDSLIPVLESMHHTTKKEDVLSTIEVIMAGISSTVLPTLDMVLNDPESTNRIDDPILDIVGHSADIRYKNNVELFKDIKTTMMAIANSNVDIVDMVKEHLSDYVTDNNAKAKDLAIIRLITDIGSLSLYIPDLVYTIIMDSDDNDIPAVRIKEIRSNGAVFGETYKAYSDGKLKTIISDIEKMGEVDIDQKAPKSMLGVALSKAGKLIKFPITRGFINNPFYHIRMLMVDWDMQRYEALQEKKRLIELRLLELKLKQSNEDTAQVRKQIQYYEDKISSMEYKLTKLKDN